MNKTQFYLSQCAEAASKSPMCFTLGAVLVKGGKVISSGYNHHRPHYDGSEVRTQGHRKPVSMHAEMHAIFSLTGMSPSFRKQGQAESQPPSHPRSKGKGKGASRPQPRRSSSSSSGDSSGSEGSRSPASEPCGSGCGGGPAGVRDVAKGWHARRRDPRANGADLYVARFTKNGMGTARPCWRCLEWCRWAGIKRIFHWNDEERKFDMIKVNNAQDYVMYETHADLRLFAGLGW
ncbi:hypothetical protein POSPLADRAFT_1061107 [Postia placenta MAD-698-R-SB12]|uniref:CMP/dCMP-type deaminase domain-containing protein n=1 Tax=Postia placenta MAD-698-R-SB12 TaxID=670580 RepID=A0A1X6MNX3_9APHY|nr:hypothetical protein POSPLADRAFT_1061107 [Postia placenta MAD-698-R-SB12]OSX58020.1 hypothetical protein POSPLADRAFT_1061107 [Postia placenta MAD-698-R-SB12]